MMDFYVNRLFENKEPVACLGQIAVCIPDQTAHA